MSTASGATEGGGGGSLLSLGGDGAAAPATEGAATPSTGQAATPAAAPEGDWKAKGYEADWLANAHGGKYKTIPDFVKGTEEFGKLVNTKAEEAKTALEKQAELAARLAGYDGILGAPKNEDGTPKPYDFKWAEGSTVDPVLGTQFEDWVRSCDLSETKAQEAAVMLQTYAAGAAMGSREVEIAGVMADYGFKPEDIEAALADPTKFGETQAGKDVGAKLANLGKFWEERAGENQPLVEAMHEVASLRGGIRFLELLRSDLSTIKNGVAGIGAGPETAAQILEQAKGRGDYFLSNPSAYQRLLEARAREKQG